MGFSRGRNWPVSGAPGGAQDEKQSSNGFTAGRLVYTRSQRQVKVEILDKKKLTPDGPVLVGKRAPRQCPNDKRMRLLP